jgi:NAD+ synthase (glutamine-hydrolysing)
LAGPDAATTSGILFDVGMPVSYNGARYNCRVWCYNGRIIGIRPKVMLADDGNYREPRWFTAWDRTVDRTASHQLACSGPGFDAGGSDITTLPASIAVFQLPLFAADALGQHWAPLGVFAVAARDVTLASEICEELFAPKPIHGELYSAGVDIISNASVRTRSIFFH